MAFAVRNVTSERGTLALALLPPQFEKGTPLHFEPFLNGKRLLTTQTFRDLFRSQVIRVNEGIGVREIALLFTDPKGSTVLYNRVGDLNAFALVQQHFDDCRMSRSATTARSSKRSATPLMAAFVTPADAVRAALAMREEVAAFNQGHANRDLALKIGIHTGAAIAVTLNDRLDYFGQTVNIAARVQSLADADDIFVSDDVFESEGGRGELSHLTVETHVAKLRGIHDDLRVYRVLPAQAV